MPSPASFRRLLSWTLLASVGAISFGACSPSIEQACADWVAADQARQKTCYGVTLPNPSRLSERDVRACVAFSQAPGSKVEPSYWEDCADLYDNRCAAFHCDPVPGGTRGSGEPCLVSAQCTSRLCKGTAVRGSDGIALPKALQCGTCAPRVPIGSPCQGEECELGASCFAGMCRQKGDFGAPCAQRADCSTYYVCRSNGICDEVAYECVTSADCTTDAGCDVSTHVCMPIKLAPAGSPCDGEVNVCEAGRCDRSTGKCPTVLADGAACDPADASKTCDYDASCFQGTCRLLDPAACK